MSLDEAAVVSNDWVLTDVGQSCSEYCLANDGYCDSSAISMVTDPESLYSQVSGNFICDLPLLETCDNLAGAYDTVNQYCYYTASDCVNVTKVACETKTVGIIVSMATTHSYRIP